MDKDAFNRLLEGVSISLPRKKKKQPKRHKYMTKPIIHWLKGVADSLSQVDDDTETYPFHPDKGLLFLRDSKSRASFIETINLTDEEKVFWLEVLKTEIVNGTSQEVDEYFGDGESDDSLQLPTD